MNEQVIIIMYVLGVIISITIFYYIIKAAVVNGIKEANKDMAEELRLSQLT